MVISKEDTSDSIDNRDRKEALQECLGLAEINGLSGMTMQEISDEVKAVRSEIKSS
jgi:hypothetical protein